MKYQRNKKGGNSGKEKKSSQNSEKQCDKRFARFRLANGSKTIGSKMVENKICKDKNQNRKYQRAG